MFGHVVLHQVHTCLCPYVYIREQFKDYRLNLVYLCALNFAIHFHICSVYYRCNNTEHLVY
jgi:hypothetical protein